MNSRYAQVAERAGHRCEYCHAPEAIFNFPFEVEHIVPPGHGGSQDDTNLALSCRSCNLFKSDRLNVIDRATGRQFRYLILDDICGKSIFELIGQAQCCPA
jgi:hypothetical protein